jgi:hypothetical protein
VEAAVEVEEGQASVTALAWFVLTAFDSSRSIERSAFAFRILPQNLKIDLGVSACLELFQEIRDASVGASMTAQVLLQFIRTKGLVWARATAL